MHALRRVTAVLMAGLVLDRKAALAQVAPDGVQGTTFQWVASSAGWIAAALLVAVLLLLLARATRQRAALMKENATLSRSEQRFHRLLDQLPDGVMVRDGESIIYANPALAAILGADSPQSLIGRKAIETVAPDDRGRVREMQARVGRGTAGRMIPVRALRNDGSAVETEGIAVATVWEGRPAFVVVIRDISERVATTERMRVLTDAIEATREGILLCGPDDRIVYRNALFGRRNPAIADKLEPGTPFEVFMRAFLDAGGVPEAKGREEEWLRQRMERHRSPLGPFEIRSLDGTHLLVSEERLANGYTVIIATDVSALKRTEEALRQSQKMEAVGQLTGGVAHDFNNLLTVILGNLQMLADTVPPATEQRFVAPAIRAARRGAALTQHLLAFSRRQPLQPKPVDAGRTISEMTELLRRTLGETVEIETTIDSALWPCEADPAQLESAILNLAINARDAMPKGGRLAIEAGNVRLDESYVADQVDVKAGPYVTISITDTGTGMPPEVAARVFDPFFTTKEPGRGTGLGLSMVYGFVKQSGGNVTVYSEPGVGTTFRLYLPRATHDAVSGPEHVGEDDDLQGHGETVLLVEDDPDVRTLTQRMLMEAGYTVLEADAADAALALVEGKHGIDLLLTDIVLPGGKSGTVLAGEVLSMRPGIAVVYMSGYSENAVIHHGRLDDDVHLLQKPFSVQDLQRKLRAALSQN